MLAVWLPSDECSRRTCKVSELSPHTYMGQGHQLVIWGQRWPRGFAKFAIWAVAGPWPALGPPLSRPWPGPGPAMAKRRPPRGGLLE